MFDGLTAQPHGVGQLVEPVLHGIEHSFVFPALEAFDFLRRATRLELTVQAGGQVTILIDFTAMI